MERLSSMLCSSVVFFLVLKSISCQTSEFDNNRWMHEYRRLGIRKTTANTVVPPWDWNTVQQRALHKVLSNRRQRTTTTSTPLDLDDVNELGQRSWERLLTDINKDHGDIATRISAENNDLYSHVKTPKKTRRFAWERPGYGGIAIFLGSLFCIRWCCYFKRSETSESSRTEANATEEQHSYGMPILLMLDVENTNNPLPNVELPPPSYTQVVSTQDENISTPAENMDRSTQLLTMPVFGAQTHGEVPPPTYDDAVAAPQSH